MRKQFKILSLFLFLGLALFLIGCTKPEQLVAPEIALNETVVSWEAVENASSYLVNVNDKSYEANETSYDLKDLKDSSFTITVIAVGDDKDFTNSEESNKLTITSTNKVELEGKEVDGKKVYKLMVQSNADVLGFEFVLSYSEEELSITEEDVKWTNILPSNWIYDVHVNDGKVKIAVTGLKPLNVRLLQNLLKLEFEITKDSAEVKLDSFEIDNG